jgi:hypothetical protein
LKPQIGSENPEPVSDAVFQGCVERHGCRNGKRKTIENDVENAIESDMSVS